MHLRLHACVPAPSAMKETGPMACILVLDMALHASFLTSGGNDEVRTAGSPLTHLLAAQLPSQQP